MMSKKILAVLTVFGFAIFTVYLAVFRHPPPNHILAANKGRKTSLAKLTDTDDPDYDPYEEASKVWDNFMVVNNYVSIGDIYDKCDESDRFMVGKLIVLPDTLLGGVTSRIFINMSLDEEIIKGEFYIEVKYNGQDLYENHFEICFKEENYDDSKRIIQCPITEGYKYFDKNMKIPNFIPKGRYTVKGWATNQHEAIFVCAFCEFIL